MTRLRAFRATARQGLVAFGLGVLTLTTVADAQPQTRRATNLAALLAYPGYYHGRPIVIVGKVGIDKNQLRVTDDADHSLHVIFKGTAPDGLG